MGRRPATPSPRWGGLGEGSETSENSLPNVGRVGEGSEKASNNSLPNVGRVGEGSETSENSLPKVGRVGEGSEKAPRIDPAILAISAGLLAIYLLLGAKALNLDGLGYAGRVESGDPIKLLLPGHLLYGPLMHSLYRLANAISPGIDAARLMQVCDSLFAAVGVGVFILALRRLAVGRFAAMAAGLALGFTYTYWTHATDLTTYAVSTLCLICSFHVLCSAHARGKPPHAWGVGALVALATLIHQSNLVFLPAAMMGAIGAPKPWRNAVKIGAVSLALILVVYGALGSAATGRLSPAAVAKWAAGGAHGFAPAFDPLNLVRGVYGFANAVLYLDDAGTIIKGHAAGVGGASLSGPAAARFAGKVALLGLMLAIPLTAYARRRRLSADQIWAARLCAVWIMPYTLVALVFFTTDHDRWIMLMPAVAALAAIAHPKLTATGKLAAVGIVAVLLGLNLTSAVYPAHTGAGSVYYQEALRLAPRLDPTDLVLFWGHDHLGTGGYLRQIKHVEGVHIVNVILENGKREGLGKLTDMVNTALAGRRRVLVIGLYGSRDTAGDYLSEAHALGLTRAEVEHALSTFTPRPSFRSNGCVVYRLIARNRQSLLFPIRHSPFPIREGIV